MLLIPISLALGAPLQFDAPVPPREFRAVWVATVDNIDWPSKRGIGTQQARAELLSILDRARALNLNAVIFQIRPSADSLYASSLEPWSEYLTGQQGLAPEPYWDPLDFAITEAHRRGLELHTWFNPYRAWHPAAKGAAHSSHISRTHPAVVKQYGKYKWMDPGERMVQDRSLSVMLDVVRRYDIDGVHIDDYFYPYRERDANNQIIDFPDDASWHRYRAGGGKLDRGDWRRRNVDTFIERLYEGIKKEKRWVKFGISPFGIYRPGIPEGIQAGVDQYAHLYADARKWLVEGWCDYYTPQLYWKIAQTPQSYPVLLKWWLEQNPKGRHLWPGNFTGQTREAGWPASEIVEQIRITREQGAGGNVHFSMRAFMQNSNGIFDALRAGPYSAPALVPPSPWLDDDAPVAPAVAATSGTGAAIRLEFSPGERSEPLRQFVVGVFSGGRWQWHTRPPANTGIALPAEAERAVVYAQDRVGNLSRPSRWVKTGL